MILPPDQLVWSRPWSYHQTNLSGLGHDPTTRPTCPVLAMILPPDHFSGLGHASTPRPLVRSKPWSYHHTSLSGLGHDLLSVDNILLTVVNHKVRTICTTQHTEWLYLHIKLNVCKIGAAFQISVLNNNFINVNGISNSNYNHFLQCVHDNIIHTWIFRIALLIVTPYVCIDSLRFVHVQLLWKLILQVPCESTTIFG